jgi:hypothetical protein
MTHRTPLLANLAGALCLVALAGCDDVGATEEFHARIDAECRQDFAGGSEDNGEIFCDCRDAAIRERNMGPFDMMDEQLMRDISDECSERVMEAMREDWGI